MEIPRVREIPVRPCCVQRHFGPICPDDKVMCCLCFGRFDMEDLNEIEGGMKENVCKHCADHEKEMVERQNSKRQVDSNLSSSHDSQTA